MAINVGANTTLPGIRGRLFPDGTFEYIPIPEREATTRSVPTYADLNLDVPAELRDTPVHLDPSFPELPGVAEYTYGDEHAVKATPLSQLEQGDFVWFYATLEPTDEQPTWAPADWGVFIIGEFRLDIDPLVSPHPAELEPEVRQRCLKNAHFARVEPDAKVVLLGDPERSRLLDRAVPLSTSTDGTDPNRCVTSLSSDSGRGPWWRRPLRFDPEGASQLVELVNRWQREADSLDNTLGSLDRSDTHVPGDPP